jgi:hypothetical protein
MSPVLSMSTSQQQRHQGRWEPSYWLEDLGKRERERERDASAMLMHLVTAPSGAITVGAATGAVVVKSLITLTL